MMEIVFVGMAWLGLMSAFAFVLALSYVILCDPKGNKG